jgi:hypothetical protein
LIFEIFLQRDGVVAPPALPPVLRPSPQGTPAALSYPLLRCLSSPSPSRAAPHSAWLQAAPVGGGGTPGGHASAQGAAGPAAGHAGAGGADGVAQKVL